MPNHAVVLDGSYHFSRLGRPFACAVRREISQETMACVE